jgi:hypothetical protein
MSSYEVRDAEERDLEQLLGLYVDLSEGDFARMPADVEVFRVVLARIISDQHRHLCVQRTATNDLGDTPRVPRGYAQYVWGQSVARRPRGWQVAARTFPPRRSR